MNRVAVLCAGGEDCPGRASVRLTDGGRCELNVVYEDESHVFPCSISALINVGLGAKTHLASEYGACTLTRHFGGVRIGVMPWGSTLEFFYVPLNIYAEALAHLSEGALIRERVSLR